VERDAIKVALLRHVKEIDGRPTLACHQAHVVAEALGVELQLIGQICNEAHIKITNCQLGCFGARSDA